MKILVVDDSVPMGRMVVEQLRLGGHNAAWVATEEAAIAAAREQGPDVVLIDIQLGDGDGLRLARKLRRLPQTNSAKLIGLSGDALPAAKRRAFDAFVRKPVRLSDLIAAVSK